MPAFGGGCGLGGGLRALEPSLDNYTDKLSLSDLKTDLEIYLNARKDEKTRELTKTSGLAWLKNRIYHACSTLGEREGQIRRILYAENSAMLSKMLLICWEKNSWGYGGAKGELAVIISKHWNRLNRMTINEKKALNTELLKSKNQQKTIEGVVVDSVAQLKSDLEIALAQRGDQVLRLVGNHETPEKRVLQAALTYIKSEKREEDVNALISVLQSSKVRAQSAMENNVVTLVQRLIHIDPVLHAACNRAQQGLQRTCSDSQCGDTRRQHQELEMIAALQIPRHVMPDIVIATVVEDMDAIEDPLSIVLA